MIIIPIKWLSLGVYTIFRQTHIIIHPPVAENTSDHQCKAEDSRYWYQFGQLVNLKKKHKQMYVFLWCLSVAYEKKT